MLVTKQAAIERGKVDLNFFARLIAPDVMEHDFPDMYKLMFNTVIEGLDEPEYWKRVLLGLPRGFVKTGFAKIILCHVITYTNLKSFMIVCATQDLAMELLADIKDLLSSPDYIKLFGDYRATATRSTTEFLETTFLGRDLKIQAKSAGSAVRGKQRRGRPQFYLLDDLQTREDSESPALSSKLYTWLLTTLLKGKDKKRAIAVYCGNKYPSEHCIVSKLEAQKAWKSIVLGALLVDAKGKLYSLWEEIQGVVSLIKEYLDDLDAGMPEAFVTEMLNGKSVGILAGMRIDKIPEPSIRMLQEQPTHRFMMIDLATSKDTTDQIVVLVCDVYPDNAILSKRMEVGKWAHDDLAKLAVNIAIQEQCPLIVYEDQGFQFIMEKELKKEVQKRGLHNMYVASIATRGRSKNFRIRNYMFKALMRGVNDFFDQLGLSAEESNVNALRLSADTRDRVIDQIKIFDPSKSNNVDDILDAHAYAVEISHTPNLMGQAVLPTIAYFEDITPPPMEVINHLSF